MSEEIKIFFAGDFFDGGRIRDLIINKDYKSVFNDFLPVIKENDLAIVNLEAPATQSDLPAKKFGPNLKMHPKSLEAIEFAGFNVLALANNHIMDYGGAGLCETIEWCKKNNINFLGAGKNLEEAKKPLEINVKGKKISFLNFAENEFSNTEGKEPGANPLNPISNFYSIKSASKHSDFVFVIIHGGHETYQLPSPRMKETYRFFIDAGADAVIGHHTHCFSGFELYKNKPVFYSIGNFIFDKPSKRNNSWNNGYAVQLIIENRNLSFKLIPYVQNNNLPGIHMLQNKEQRNFEETIKKLNAIILDDQLLENEFNGFYNKVKSKYASFIELYNNKYLNALRKRGLFPSLIRKNKKRLFLNLVRCESHRDILLKLLKE